MKPIFNAEQIQFMKDNYRSMSYAQIAEALGGYTERQVRGKINGLGLSKVRQFNKAYFSEIDDPNKAYWLGFIYADGYTVANSAHRNYELSIELNHNDGYILEEFVRAIGGSHPVQLRHSKKSFNGYVYETDSALVRVYSRQIVTDLISLGVVPGKTYSQQYPTCEQYLADFVRGYLDGDGCIYVRSDKGTRHAVVHFTCSNVSFLEYLNRAIADAVGISGKIYQEKENKYRLMFYRHADVKELLDWMYSRRDIPMLRRKFEKYALTYGLAA